MTLAPLRPRYTGRLGDLSPTDRKGLVTRAASGTDPELEERVARIVSRVRNEGDRSLFELTRDLDRVSLEALEVPRARWAQAADGLDPALRKALERSADHLARVHRAFLPAPIEIEVTRGVRVGRRPDPLAAVGIYAPGGRAAYPSSVLMGVVPAKVASVREIVVATPPGPSGAPSDVVLAAAHIGGASRVFALGGAQAIAALAFGTETVPKVDRIVGPGNAYVSEAKRQVAGTVAIDSPAGPSEILIVADATSHPEVIVRELLAQAEHDPEASCVALVTDPSLADAALELLAQASPARREVIQASISSRGGILVGRDLDEAVDFVAEYAPEHLLLSLHDPLSTLERCRHAGTVFLGESASVAFGDYMTGANHVLPTAGFARSFSGLSSIDFVRFTTWQEVTPEAARELSFDTATLADAEGLASHAAAARSAGRNE